MPDADDPSDADWDAAVREAELAATSIRWRHVRTLRRAFGARYYFARLVLITLPPVTRWTFISIGEILVLVTLGWLGILSVAYMVPGSSSVDVQYRWFADVSLVIILLAGIAFPVGLLRDVTHRAVPFPGGQKAKGEIAGYAFSLSVGGRRYSIQLVAIRRVRRLFGVTALQLPTGRYWGIPSELFPSRSEWAAIQRLLSSS